MAKGHAPSSVSWSSLVPGIPWLHSATPSGTMIATWKFRKAGLVHHAGSETPLAGLSRTIPSPNIKRHQKKKHPSALFARFCLETNVEDMNMSICIYSIWRYFMCIWSCIYIYTSVCVCDCVCTHRFLYHICCLDPFLPDATAWHHLRQLLLLRRYRLGEELNNHE